MVERPAEPLTPIEYAAYHEAGHAVAYMLAWQHALSPQYGPRQPGLDRLCRGSQSEDGTLGRALQTCADFIFDRLPVPDRRGVARSNAMGDHLLAGRGHCRGDPSRRAAVVP